ncbi:aminotransferase class I/II-fold pyridoxal phosphate-dependent enzyme, partial [Anaerolineae bacterium CFX8]|nr:aminotransferase class I/II-fold pyridoxal phosphate-dependent enzyme [Anaerolineae bacterium CFX8]
MPTAANRVATFGTTIFTEINDLAARHRAINLGQGKPDFDGPSAVVAAAVRALQSGQHNQYAPGPGLPALKQGIATHAAAHYNLDIDPDAGVIINPLTASGQVEGGMTQALGYAVCEEMRYDKNGRAIERDLDRYHIFRADEMPELETIFV